MFHPGWVQEKHPPSPSQVPRWPHDEQLLLRGKPRRSQRHDIKSSVAARAIATLGPTAQLQPFPRPTRQHVTLASNSTVGWGAHVERLLERRRDLRPQPAQRTRFRPPAFCRWFHGRLLPRRLRLARHNVQQGPPSRQHHRRRALPLGAARNPHRRRQKQPTRHHHGRPGHPPWW
jgi:hypothetical protein